MTVATRQLQTFHQSMSKVLVVAQLFGILPLRHVLAPNVQSMYYSWLNVHTIYATLVITLSSIELGTVLTSVYLDGLSFHTSGLLSFYIVCLLEHVYFWRLAIHWPSIMRQWHRVEVSFLRAPYHWYSTFNLKRRMYTVSSAVMLCALAEHVIFLLNSLHKSQLEVKQCHLNSSTLWEVLYRHERPHLTAWLPFRLWILPILEWSNLCLAFPRSFTDVFIMCLSIGLTIRYQQLYLRIETVYSKALPSVAWSEIREHYLQLQRLVRLLNAMVSPLIVLAFSNNMYFICFQLFNSFQNIGVDLVAVFVFWYSLLSAIVRTLLTIYVASIFNDYTRKMLKLLREVPSGSWCLELQRFSEQLSGDVTALSGHGFFSLTRKLILAMTSTIVTYELMVADVINQGQISQKTDFCKTYYEDDM